MNGLMLTLGWVLGAVIYTVLKAQAVSVEPPQIGSDQPCLPCERAHINLQTDDLSVDVKELSLDHEPKLYLIEEARDLADRVSLMQQEMGITP
jgi:hypothetical protein